MVLRLSGADCSAPSVCAPTPAPAAPPATSAASASSAPTPSSNASPETLPLPPSRSRSAPPSPRRPPRDRCDRRGRRLHRRSRSEPVRPICSGGRFDAALARYLIARDQHCRIPSCTASIRHLDHITPWRGDGPTSATNGQGFSERHSYTQQAPGWHIRVVNPANAPGDGLPRRHLRHTTLITTPTGHTYQSQATPPTAEDATLSRPPGLSRGSTRSIGQASSPGTANGSASCSCGGHLIRVTASARGEKSCGPSPSLEPVDDRKCTREPPRESCRGYRRILA
jgi:hypothetical protein